VSEHPLALFIFSCANLIVALVFIYLGVLVYRRVGVGRTTKTAGVAFNILAAFTHIAYGMRALFDSQRSFGDGAAQWFVVATHTLMAVCGAVFISGVFVQIGVWGLLPARKDKAPDVTSEPEP
jgi:fucose 4-O-acetylase-like acetyltransferase